MGFMGFGVRVMGLMLANATVDMELCIFTGQRVWFRLSVCMSVSLTSCLFLCLSVVFSDHVGGLKDPSNKRDSAGTGFQFRTHEGVRAWQSEVRMDGIDGGEGRV